jgi:phosphoribosyl-AMP cyclohydrolase
MVLPLLPAIDSLEALNFKSETLSEKAIYAIGQILVQNSVEKLDEVVEQLSKTSTNLDVVVDIEGLSTDQLVKVLDAGASKVVVSKTQLSDLRDISADRILARLSEDQVATPAGVEEIANNVAGVILNSSFTISVDPESLKSIVKSLRTSFLPSGGQRTVYLEYTAPTPQPDIAELKSLALLSIEPIIHASYLTSSPKENPSLLSVAQVAMLSAKTDRPDGLYATVVVDESERALGLVYSSAESIAESIKTGTGVYQSRERGLWYKGATSGATQEILGMAWDCDADCLRFTVKQAGKGTSHNLSSNGRVLSSGPNELFWSNERSLAS